MQISVSGLISEEELLWQMTTTITTRTRMSISKERTPTGPNSQVW
jgi:hypothetical protein